MAYNDWTLDDGRIIQLITPETLSKLDVGTRLIDIYGEDAFVGLNTIDNDTRGGLLAYGRLKEGDGW